MPRIAMPRIPEDIPAVQDREYSPVVAVVVVDRGRASNRDKVAGAIPEVILVEEIRKARLHSERRQTLPAGRCRIGNIDRYRGY